MHVNPDAGCPSPGQVWRDEGYSTDIENESQVLTMVSDARTRAIARSCN